MVNNVQIDTPLVSIVMPTYNGEKFIREQLGSLLEQDYRNFELIISDDSSTDGTLAIIQEYEAKDNRIQVLKSTTNLGVIANLNKACKYAKGEYVAIADQDDIWTLDKLSRLLKVIQDKSLAYCKSQLIDEKGKCLGRSLLGKMKKPLFEGQPVFELITNNTISGHALLVRTSLLKKVLPFSGKTMYDHELAQAAALVDGIIYVDEPLVLHRMHNSNQTNKLLRNHRIKRSASDKRDGFQNSIQQALLIYHKIDSTHLGVIHKDYITWLEKTNRLMSQNIEGKFSIKLGWHLINKSRLLFPVKKIGRIWNSAKCGVNYDK